MKQAMLRWTSTLPLAAACVVLAAALSHLTPARAEPPGAAKAQTQDRRPSVDDICHTLAQAAADNELPEELFTRLIWQESHFDPAAVSPAGAQGIAQFMPGTAAMRGLTNAFEPLQALRESASYLRELRTTFRGNLGLAAAAYNAGPGPEGSRFLVRVSEERRQAANALCAKLMAAGGACIVLRNPRD